MRIFFLLLAPLIWVSCQKESPYKIGDIGIDSVHINQALVPHKGLADNVPLAPLEVSVFFSRKIDSARFNTDFFFFSGSLATNYTHRFSSDKRSVTLVTHASAQNYQSYSFNIQPSPNLGGTLTADYSCTIRTVLDLTPKFPLITNDSLLSLVQQQTLRYFTQHAHPTSKLARERHGSGDVVTTGGSGFGLMALVVGMQRDWITRQQGVDQIKTMVDFLSNPSTERFHGAYPHWLNGATGKTIAFSTKDNGADLVETAYLIAGLLTVKEYFKNGTEAEQAICDQIDTIWRAVEWDWFRRDGQNKLYWHWSPTYGWDMNVAVTGWNEALIVYILAAASPTHQVPKEVYTGGWARNGAIVNNKTFYGTVLPLGEDRGGPLFFSHYTFMGINPNGLVDTYADYGVQNTAHARINYLYCMANPKKQRGYGSNCWGLTASDTPNGYMASSPHNDVGVIAPTAALASFPYTPNESMAALNFFYYVVGDRLWGEYGFKDAFSLNNNWFAGSYLAIDQGPIVVMIENHRTQLIWDLLMQNNDVANGLSALGFTRQQ